MASALHSRTHAATVAHGHRLPDAMFNSSFNIRPQGLRGKVALALLRWYVMTVASGRWTCSLYNVGHGLI